MYSPEARECDICHEEFTNDDPDCPLCSECLEDIEADERAWAAEREEYEFPRS